MGVTMRQNPTVFSPPVQENVFLQRLVCLKIIYKPCPLLTVLSFVMNDLMDVLNVFISFANCWPTVGLGISSLYWLLFKANSTDVKISVSINGDASVDYHLPNATSDISEQECRFFPCDTS
ncbi:hypothetical protein TNCV_1916531 [Trichonephila clavipes]|uniref:Uncharacterized protein n=1 Tax=Trichonephila clavipes TaxID=2585209 RepID=A0A8X6W0I6_TRICX|nr:hypothetical protein TNCV_1916531 [Trichonephila clavipes]